MVLGLSLLIHEATTLILCQLMSVLCSLEGFWVVLDPVTVEVGK